MKTELNQEDRERIEQFINKLGWENDGTAEFNDMMRVAEYENKYQREQQAKALPEALQEARSKLMYIAANAMNEDVQRQANVAWQKITTVALSLEAERTELRNKIEEYRQLLLRSEMYILPTEQTNGLIADIRNSLKTKDEKRPFDMDDMPYSGPKPKTK